MIVAKMIGGGGGGGRGNAAGANGIYVGLMAAIVPRTFRHLHSAVIVSEC